MVLPKPKGICAGHVAHTIVRCRRKSDRKDAMFFCKPLKSIVFFENDFLAIESGLFQHGADFVDHLMQSADVDVDIAAMAERFERVGLHAAGAARPVFGGTRESRQIAEVGMCGGERGKLVVVEEAMFVTHAEDQRELMVGVSAQMRKQHGAKG